MQQDGTFDALLIEGLLLAASEEAEELKKRTPVEFSPAYQKFRLKLLADPFRYARRRKRPLWKKMLQTVACFLLALVIGLGAIMAVSPSACAEFIRWLREVGEYFSVYRFVDDPQMEVLPVYEIGEIPEGYAKADQTDGEGFHSVTYQNMHGDRIWFAYMWMRQGNSWAVDTANVDVLDVEVNGCQGEFYYYPDGAQPNGVIWRDEDAGIIFCLDMIGEKDEILQVAAGIVLTN